MANKRRHGEKKRMFAKRIHKTEIDRDADMLQFRASKAGDRSARELRKDTRHGGRESKDKTAGNPNRGAEKTTGQKNKHMNPNDKDQIEEDIETTEDEPTAGKPADGDGVEDDDSDETDEDEEDEGAGEDEDGEESDEDEDGESEEEEDGDGDEDGAGKGMGKRARQRIGKLTGEVKDLKRELEEARRMGGDDGKAILAAAETAGILPQLMSADEAKGIRELDSKTGAVKYLKKLLRSDDDEFEIGGETRSRRWVQGELDDLMDEVGELRERYGAKRRELAEKSKEIFELGMAARKAGWKPGERSTRPGGRESGRGKGASSGASKLKHASGPKRKEPTLARRKGGKRSVDWGGVTDNASAEAMILAEMEN